METDIKAQVELEMINLRAYEELCKLLEVEPVVVVTPGRDYDAGGELASWYEDKYYPEFTKSKQKKLLNYILRTPEAPQLVAHLATLLLRAGSLNEEEIKEVIEK